jgi:HSP20 family molecular chaperone IbpA
MKHSTKKIFIPVLSVFSGFVISFLAFRANPHLINRVSAGEMRKESPPVAPSGLLKNKQHEELFEEMERMQERMRDHFENFDRHDLVIGDPFGDTRQGGVDQREDSDYVYLDVPIDDVDETTVDTTIANDHVTVSGTIEKKYDTCEGLYRSFFSRTFPLPEGVNQNQIAVVPQKGKVTLKFPKIKV